MRVAGEERRAAGAAGAHPPRTPRNARRTPRGPAGSEDRRGRVGSGVARDGRVRDGGARDGGARDGRPGAAPQGTVTVTVAGVPCALPALSSVWTVSVAVPGPAPVT